MTQNVGEVEIDARLDTDQLSRDARQGGERAGTQFERGIADALRRAERRAGRDYMDSLLSNMEREVRTGTGGIERQFRQMTRRIGRDVRNSRIGRDFDTLFVDISAGITALRRRFLGFGATLGPILVPLIALLAEIGPAIAIALPALAATAGIIAVIALSTEALGKAFKPLVEGFKSLKGPISEIVTFGIRPLVKDLTEGLIPVLRGGLSAVARFVNGVIFHFLRFLKSVQGLRLIRQILFGVADAMGPLLKAVKPLTRVLLTLTRAAIPGFKVFNEEIADLIIRFDGWIQSLARTGELQREITKSVEILLTTLKFLGNVFLGLVDAGRFFADILAPVAALLGDMGVSVRDVTKFVAIFLGAFFALIIPLNIVFSVLGAVVGLIGSLGTVFAAIFSPIGAVIAAIALLVGGFVLLYLNSEPLRTAVADIGSALKDLAEFVIPIAIEAAKGLWAFFRDELLPEIKRIAEQVGENLAPALEAVADFIRDDLIPALGEGREEFKKLWPEIKPVVVQVVRLIGALARVSATIAGTVIPKLADMAGVLARSLGPAIRGVTAVVRAMKTTFDNAREAASLIAGVVRGALSGALRVARTHFSQLRSAVSTARDVLGSIAGVISSVAGAIEGLIGRVRDLISALGDIVVPNINLPNVPGIPGFMTGGIVKKPTIALMGERSRMETIIPNTMPDRALALMQKTGLDKLVLERSATTGPTYAPTFNVTVPTSDVDAFVHMANNRLRLRLGF
jgi:phage-related protein